MFTLIIEDKHGGIADEYSFEEGEFYIGRSHTSDIILPSDNVSRRHARLYTVDGKCYIEDLNSSNGVFVNGRRIHEVYQIQRSAQIKVGDYYLHIESDTEASVEEEKTWCKLIGRNLAFTNQVFRVQRKVNLIGRGKDCTLTIIDPSVSRIHTKLSIERSGALTVEDLKSSNGTFINDERIEVATLHHRDVLRFGNVEFLVEMTEPEAAAPRATKDAQREVRRDRSRSDERAISKPKAVAAHDDIGLAPPPPNRTSTAAPAPSLAAQFEDVWNESKKGTSWVLWVAVIAAVIVVGTVLVIAFREQIFGTSTPAPTAETRPIETAPPTPPVPTAEQLAAEAARERDKKVRELQQIIDVGKDHVRARQWDLALGRFQAALELDPLSEEAQRGVNYVKNMQVQKTRLEEARRLRDALKRGEAAKILREIDDASPYHAEAQDELKKLLEAKPTLFLTADNLLRDKDCLGALATLKELQLVDPKDEEVGIKMDAVQKLVGTKKCAN